MRPLPPPTELQEVLACVRDCLATGRERLTPEGYRWFCHIARETFGAEVVRITMGDLLREIREEGGE